MTRTRASRLDTENKENIDHSHHHHHPSQKPPWPANDKPLRDISDDINLANYHQSNSKIPQPTRKPQTKRQHNHDPTLERFAVSNKVSFQSPSKQSPADTNAIPDSLTSSPLNRVPYPVPKPRDWGITPKTAGALKGQWRKLHSALEAEERFQAGTKKRDNRTKARIAESHSAYLLSSPNSSIDDNRDHHMENIKEGLPLTDFHIETLVLNSQHTNQLHLHTDDTLSTTLSHLLPSRNNHLIQPSRHSLLQASDIFGLPLYDYGYKKGFSVSCAALLSHIGIWVSQRPCDPDRVAQIVKTKLKQNSDLGRVCFPGVISLFEFQKDISAPSIENPQRVAVFDGQHRVSAIKELLDLGVNDFQIVIEVFPVRHQYDIAQWFLEINRAEPVQEIDLPDAICGTKKQIIDKTCAELHDRFKACISTSIRCRPPNVNISVLRNNLFIRQVVEKGSYTNFQQLLDKLLTINSQLSKKPDDSWPPSLHKPLTKAKKFNFFLGMSYDWLDTIF